MSLNKIRNNLYYSVINTINKCGNIRKKEDVFIHRKKRGIYRFFFLLQFKSINFESKIKQQYEYTNEL